MSDNDPLLGLMDDLLKLELPDGLSAVTIEVEADGFAVSVSRQGQTARTTTPAIALEQASVEKTQRVHATTVGLFSTAREWSTGDAVARGDVLGGIQSLGHVAEISAPADGEIREVLVTGGAPVEYGQALFVISLR
ncbi:MAG: biotin/lipoyl-containing protein [Chloroflexota bacterium]